MGVGLYRRPRCSDVRAGWQQRESHPPRPSREPYPLAKWVGVAEIVRPSSRAPSEKHSGQPASVNSAQSVCSSLQSKFLPARKVHFPMRMDFPGWKWRRLRAISAREAATRLHGRSHCPAHRLSELGYRATFATTLAGQLRASVRAHRSLSLPSGIAQGQPACDTDHCLLRCW